MANLKELIRNCLQVAPFILSNTIVFIPYFLFLSLTDGTTMERILPFVLFYTFRMTGIFLLKSFKLALSSFNILILSILLGGTGCLIGVFGQFYFSAYLFSAILLGLSASWLPAANTTVNYHEKRQGYSALTGRKYFFLVLVFVGGIASLMLTKELKIPIILGEYALLYIAAYHTVTHYPNYEIDFNEVGQHMISIKEFTLFLVFFVLLLFVRLARLLFDSQLLDIGVIGFSMLFLVATLYINRQRKMWGLPLWLNLLTFANGMCLNFLLLFGTFYVSLRLGINHLTVNLYVPYILGIVGAAIVIKLLYRMFPKVDIRIMHLSGFIFSLLLLLFRPLFPIGIFLLSCFISATGNFLNQCYYQDETLPQDRRLITKYSTQTKGSVTHQLLLMSVLWLLAKQAHLPAKTVLQITAHQTHNPIALQLVEHVHTISIIGLMSFFFFILYVVIKSKRSQTYEQIKPK